MADRAICSAEGCDKPCTKRGFCGSHYKKWWRYGDPLAGRKTGHGETIRWLRAHVDHEGDECLIWPFSRRADGYGNAQIGRLTMRASRAMCIFAHGDPPEASSEAAHSCGRGHEGCVSPAHLRWASSAENAADTIAHGNTMRGERQWSAKLTAPDVRQIRKLLASGSSQASVASRFGVTAANIQAIASGRAWGWLT